MCCRNRSRCSFRSRWEEAYQNELNNFTDHGDVGEVWFGSQNECRVVKWMLQNAEKASHVLDIGCGNGHLLIQLAKEGFTGLTGTDYAKSAVTLAKELAAKEAVSVTFEHNDILEDAPSRFCRVKKYDFVLDKGTYDAISLCPNNAKAQCERYIHAISQLLAVGGRFVIVSCNWTQQELTAHFEPELTLLDVIPTPTFAFGGSQGKSVTALVFGRKPQPETS
uniref:Protein-lysine N-methyltransferase n=1 Tax=Amblyomma maculatum TaxID=34609 RepID=G3MQQ9_AMBMU